MPHMRHSMRMNFATKQPHNVGLWSESNNSFTSHGIVVIYFGYLNTRIYPRTCCASGKWRRRNIFAVSRIHHTYTCKHFQRSQSTAALAVLRKEAASKLLNEPAQISQCMQRRSPKHCHVICHYLCVFSRSRFILLSFQLSRHEGN